VEDREGHGPLPGVGEPSRRAGDAHRPPARPDRPAPPPGARAG
jgi:hypothetical protein